MQHRCTFYLLSAVVITTLLSSCGKKYSNDDPLPEVFTPSIYIGSQNQFVYAFDPVKGTKKWEFNAGGNIQSTPLYFNNSLYVASFSGTSGGVLYKLDANHGTITKKTTFLGAQLVACPLVDGNTIYMATLNDTIYAVDANSLAVTSKFGTGGPLYSSPVIKDGKLIIGSYDGKVYALDKGNLNTVIWTYDNGSGGAAGFYSSPTVNGKFIYLGCNDGKMYTLDLNSGGLLWTFNTGAQIKSSPIAYGGNVIFGSGDYTFYCVDTASHLTRWVINTPDQVVSSPFAYNQVIYFGGNDQYLYAVHIINGAVKWRYKPDSSALIKSSPLGYDGKIYYGGYDKYLYALDTASGNVVWKQNINGAIECSPVVGIPDQAGVHPSISGMSQY